jgi:hypothetical protein
VAANIPRFDPEPAIYQSIETHFVETKPVLPEALNGVSQNERV